VFYSAYIPVSANPLLPSLNSRPPLLREHRLYQADWLLRFYGFEASELLDEKHPTLNPLIDPKSNWAINHMELFPVDINSADKEMLLRIPGIGVKSVLKILKARKHCRLDFDMLRQMGVSLKRARYFITCSGKAAAGITMDPDIILNSLITAQGRQLADMRYEQLSLFSNELFLPREEVLSCVSGQI